MDKPREKNLWKGALAGMAGGLAASLVMNRFQALLATMAEERARSHGAQSNQQSAPHRGIALELQKRGSDEAQDDAAMRIGNALSAGILDRDLTTSEKHTAGTVIHYIFGTATGMAYGALAEWVPQITVVGGVPMGTFVWITADEMTVPALGLSEWFTEYPLSTHASSLASHLVYGLTTELIRWTVRKKL